KIFADAKKHDWPKTDFKQTEEDPAVNVSWDDATAFCKRLTEKEQKAGLITATQSYRLPKDLEWSAAVGLNKESGSTPGTKRQSSSEWQQACGCAARAIVPSSPYANGESYIRRRLFLGGGRNFPQFEGRSVHGCRVRRRHKGESDV